MLIRHPDSAGDNDLYETPEVETDVCEARARAIFQASSP